MTIEYSGSTTEYTGTYKKIYRIDRSGIEKGKRELKEKLGPSYENYFKINFKLMSQKYVIFHITGRNEFVSRSRYGNKRYTAFTVNKDVKSLVNTYNSKEIENEKKRGILNEVNHWNGRRHYYLSPGGRHISRQIKTSKRDFVITLKSLLEVKSPQRIDVFSKLSPNNKINLITRSNRTKVCVKCGNSFIPIDWNGWTIKYLSSSNVYVCENCNKNLKEIIKSEKIKRSTYESEKSGLETKQKSLKRFLIINICVMLPSIFLISYYLILFLSLFSCLTASLIALYLKLKQSSKKLSQIINLERSRRIEVLDGTKCIDIASLLEEIDLIKEKNQIIRPIKPKQKIEPLKAKSYNFNGFILTIYDSNNKRLATIPRERFNKTDSSFYYCECGKYYLRSTYLFKHLINSTDCINLFLLNKTEEKISSKTIKKTSKIAITNELKNSITSPKQKIEPLKSKSYDFNGFILTIYDSNDKKLATIPRKRFNKKDSSLYYCMCGKYYLSSTPLFKHLLKSTNCIDLFLFTQAEEKIYSSTKELKDQEKTQVLEITDNNILSVLDDKLTSFKDLSSKFIIKDTMDESHLKYRLKILVRKEYVSQDNNLYWKINPSTITLESKDLINSPKQKIEPLKAMSYDFDGFILTFYDSNNKVLATIPRERFNEKDSSQYHCKCGKYYLGPTRLFKHLGRSTDCINLFLMNEENKEKISSRAIKTTPKIVKTKIFKDREKTQLLEITERNILKTLNDKPIIFKDLSSKFIIKDAMDERYLKYKLKALVRKDYASQEFLDNNLQFNWKLNPNFREREKAELTEKDSIAISILKNYSYYPKTLICYKNSHIIVKKGIYNFIPEISQFLKTLDGDLKREFFRTEAYKWRRKLNLLNLNSDRKKEEYISILNQDLEESGSIEKDVVLLLDLDKNLIFFNEGDTNLDIIVKSDWTSYNTISTSKESFKKKINNYLN